MMTVIEIQDKIISRMSAARAFKTASMLWANACKQARKELLALGFDDMQANVIISDAQDIEILNFACVDPSHIRHRAAVARGTW